MLKHVWSGKTRLIAGEARLIEHTYRLLVEALQSLSQDQVRTDSWLMRMRWMRHQA